MKISRLKLFILTLWALTIILVSCAKGSLIGGFDWPRWGGPDGNWISKEKSWNPKALVAPRILWTTDLSYGYSNVAIEGGHLYTMGGEAGDNLIYCLSPNTGQIIWKYPFSGSQTPQSTPTAGHGLVFALSTEGVLFCLNAQNGKLQWKKDLVADYGAVKPYYGFAGPPVIEGNLLLLTSNSAGLALDRETGQLVWNSSAPPPPDQIKAFWSGYTNGTDYSAPVTYKHSGRRCALFSSWKGISAVDVQSGKPDWLYEWDVYNGNTIPDPVVSGGMILIIGGFSTLMDQQSVLVENIGEKPLVHWKSRDLWADITTPVIIGGYIYGCFGGPNRGLADLRCLDLQTGRLMWKQELKTRPRVVSLALTAADGKLIVLDDQGILYIAEASSAGYKEISSCDVLSGEKKIRKFWTPPVLCNGKIYCRNFNGELICIDVSK